MAGHTNLSEHWDQRYLSGDAPWNSGMVSQELIRVLRDEHVAPCHAVELGCGVGTNAVHLAQQGFDVLATDCSAVAIAQAQIHAAEVGVSVNCVMSDLCRLAELQSALGATSSAHCQRYSFLFDRGCYHCARRIDLVGFLETVEWLAAPNAQMLLLCGNANEPGQAGPPKVTDAELRSECGHLFEIEWIREFRFEDRGGIPGPLGWSCWMTRRAVS